MLALEVPDLDLSSAYKNPEQVRAMIAMDGRIERRRLLQLAALDSVSVDPGQVALALDAEGSLDSLRSLRLRIDDAGTTHLDLSAQGSALLDFPDSRVELAVDSLSYTDEPGSLLHALAGDGFLPSWVRGTLNGSLADGAVDIRLDLATELGSVHGSLAGSGLEDARPDAYDAELELLELDLATLTGDTLLGPLSVRITGEGQDLMNDRRRAWLQVDPLEAAVAGKDVSSLCLLAEAFGDSLFAHVEVEAKPLVLDLRARSDLPDGDPMQCDLHLDLKRAELGELGLMDRDFLVQGDWTGTLVLDTTGHGTADLEATDLRLASGERKFGFEHFRLQALYASDSLAADLDSDALKLTFRTNTPADQLGKRITEKVMSMLRPDLPFQPDPTAELRLDAEVPGPELFTGLLVPDLQALEVETIHLTYSGASDALDARIDIPVLTYDSVEVSGLVLTAGGSEENVRADLSVAYLSRGSWYVPGLGVGFAPQDDWLRTELKIGVADSTTHHLAAYLQGLGDTLVIRLDEEQVLANTTWTASPTNQLRLSPGHVSAEDFGIRNGGRFIRFNTSGAEPVLEVERLPLEGLTSMIASTDSVELATGLLSGEVKWSGELPEADLRLDDLHALGADIGMLHVMVEPRGNDQAHAKAELERGNNRMDVVSDMTLAEESTFTAQADIGFADLSFLEPFLGDLLFDLAGGLNGRIDVEKRAGTLRADGDLAFDRTRFGLVETGAVYQIPDGRLHLDGRNVELDGFRVLDSLDQAMVLDGSVSFADLSDPTMDLRIRTDRFRAVHSTAKENDVFYGDLFGRLDLTAKGPLAHPALSGSVGVLPGTRFSVVLPGSEVELVESEGVVEFTQELFVVDTTVTGGHAALVRDSLMARLPGVDLDVKVTVDPEARFFIVLDPTSGDEATVRGSGDLAFQYDAAGNMALNGSFEVVEGGYTLEFYGLVHKRFDMVKGSSITWSGDPVKAGLDLTALYQSTTAPYALVSGSESLPEEEQNRLKKPLPFDVLIHFGGRMDDPELTFTLDLDDQYRRRFPMVDGRLEALDQPGNKEELERQVFGLLVLNSFIQDAGNETVAASDLATTAARNSMNGLLTDQLNKLTGRYLKGVDISVGMYTYDQSSGGRTFQRTSLDYKVSKRLLNDRLTFEVGGAVDMDDQNDQVNNVANTRAAEYAILYDVTPDGRFQLRGFHENSYDLYDGEITRSGVAFMFTREFRMAAREAAHEEARKRNEGAPRPDEDEQDPGKREDE